MAALSDISTTQSWRDTLECPLCGKSLESHQDAAEHLVDEHNSPDMPSMLNGLVICYRSGVTALPMVNLWCFCRHRHKDLGLTGFLGMFRDRQEGIKALAKHLGHAGGIEKHFEKWLLQMVKGEA